MKGVRISCTGEVLPTERFGEVVQFTWETQCILMVRSGAPYVQYELPNDNAGVIVSVHVSSNNGRHPQEGHVQELVEHVHVQATERRTLSPR